MAVRVTVLTDQPLVSLFRSIPGIEVPFPCVYDDDEYDYHVPLMCLPRLFGTTIDTIPADVPYLSAAPAKVDRWAQRLSRLRGQDQDRDWSGPAAHGSTIRRLMRLIVAGA